MADVKDWEANKIDTELIQEISPYDQVCKALRDEVKINASIRNKDVLRKRAAEQKRGSTVLRADRDFEKIIEDFEEQKNKDLKAVLMNFVNIQLKAHLEGVNNLMEMYTKLRNIDCAEDAKKFKDSVVKGVSLEDNSQLIKTRSQSMGALNNLMHSSNPFRRLSTKQLNKSQEDILTTPEGRKISKEAVATPRVVETEESSNDDDNEGADTHDSEEEDEEDNESDDSQQESINRKLRLNVPRYN